jgi:hypothetical protein
MESHLIELQVTVSMERATVGSLGLVVTKFAATGSRPIKAEASDIFPPESRVSAGDGWPRLYAFATSFPKGGLLA